MAIFNQGDLFQVTFEKERDGPIARVNGKIAFPERGGRLPQEGETWEVELAGVNPRGTVQFLRLIRKVEAAMYWELDPCTCTAVRKIQDRYSWFHLVHDRHGHGKPWNEVNSLDEIDPKKIQEAIAAGCPQALVDQAKAKVQAQLDAADEATRLFGEAVAGAYGLAGEGVVPLILPASRPGPTQWLDPQCVEVFTAAWEAFMEKVTIGGGNRLYRWGTVPEGIQLEVSGNYWYSHLSCSWRDWSPSRWDRPKRVGTIKMFSVSQGDHSPKHWED